MSINITEFINACVNNIEAWLPTVTAVVSALVCCIWGVARLKKAANDLKSDKTIAELRAEVEQDITENKETRKLERRILNKLYKMYDIGESNETGENGAKHK